MSKEIQELRKRLALRAAWLIVVGLATGIWAAAALTDMIHVAQPRLALGAHLSALMGGLWMLAISYTFEFLDCSYARMKLISRLVTGANWGNWSITLLASFLGVNGLSFNQNAANNLVAVLLQAIVVIPSLIAAVIWARSF